MLRCQRRLPRRQACVKNETNSNGTVVDHTSVNNLSATPSSSMLGRLVLLGFLACLTFAYEAPIVDTGTSFHRTYSETNCLCRLLASNM